MTANIQQHLIFKGKPSGHYLILTSGTNTPAGYQAIEVNSELQSAQIVSSLAHEFHSSDTHLGYAKGLVNIKQVVNYDVVTNTLKKAIFKKQLTVYKDIPKDVNAGTGNIFAAAVGAVSTLTKEEVSTKGAVDGSLKTEGASTSAVVSDTPTSSQPNVATLCLCYQAKKYYPYKILNYQVCCH